MKNLQKLMFGLVLAMGVLFVGCDDDDSTPTDCAGACPAGFICENGQCVPENANTVVVNNEITADETWTKDNIYELPGKVVVKAGATLTIEAGTIVKGREGTGSLASALIIARGAKIEANGTATEPIIFTSVLDDIEPGQITGTNLDATDNEKWGGLIVLGNARISASDGDTEAKIEGIPPEDDFGFYGGTDDTDNSGTLNYISIRHGGALIGEGNEINGLTLGGVGNGTTISNVEVIANLDDGIECFGGSVNISNAIVAYQGDDAIDLDQNYSGTISNVAVIQSAAATSDEALEIDGPEGSTYTDGLFTITNGTFITENDGGSAGDLKSLAQGTIENSCFSGFSSGLKIRASFQNECAEDRADTYTHMSAMSPTMIIQNNGLGTADIAGFANVYTESQNSAEEDCMVPAAYQTAADDLMSAWGNVDACGAGADLSVFNGWTWSSVNNIYSN